MQLDVINVLSLLKRPDCAVPEFILSLLLSTALPGVLDQDAPHRPGHGRKEIGAAGGLEFPRLEDPDIGLVYQRRGLQGVTGALPDEQISGHLIEFGIHPLDERLLRLEVARHALADESGDLPFGQGGGLP